MENKMEKSKKCIIVFGNEHLSSVNVIDFIWNFSSYHYHGSEIDQIKSRPYTLASLGRQLFNYL